MAVEASTLGEAPADLLPRVVADAQLALQALGLADAELSVVLCDDASIQPLNRDWRGKDAPTDVLSFPQEEEPALRGGEVGEGMPPRLLGDIVVSVQTAQRQADALGHDLQAELRVLLVHGLCHLLGHDHHDPEEAEAMRAMEGRLLAALQAGAEGLVARSLEPDGLP